MKPFTSETGLPTPMTMGKVVFRGSLILCLLGFVAAIGSAPAVGVDLSRSESRPAVSVKDFGARGDGLTDDRPSIQAAIDSLANGGTVYFPAGTYLMDSYITAKAGDNFNLVTSHDHLTFEPAPGTPAGSVKLVQGPKGWGTFGHRTFGPLAVFNSEFFLASPIGQNGYQNIHQNGGYFTLEGPISVQSATVTFAKRSDTGRFAVGDWIAVSETTDQQIEPLEINQVVSVDAGTGIVGLRWPQTQTYPTGFAARVTHMVRSNITIRGLTLQGVMPCFLNDLYDFQILDCKILCDVTYVAPEKGGAYIFANAVRQMLFKDNVVADFPAGAVANVNGIELPQNNSMDVTIEHNTFLAAAGGGEYWAHWVLRDNNFQISPPPSGKHHGVCLQGYDILFEGNTLTSTASMDYLYTDFSTAPNNYKWLFGAQKVRNNRFSSAAGANAVRIYTPDTEFSGNLVVSAPGQHALLMTISGRPHQDIPQSEVKATNIITNNTFHGADIPASGCVVLRGPSLDEITFRDNILIGHHGAEVGLSVEGETIDVDHRALALDTNHFEGFKTPVFYVPRRAEEKAKAASP